MIIANGVIIAENEESELFMFEIRKKTGWSIKRIIAAVLLGISFLMLVFPWISIWLNVNGQKYSVGKLMNAFGLPYSQYREEIVDMLSVINEEMASAGAKLQADKVITLLEIISKESISPVEIARACSNTASILNGAKKYFTVNYQDLYGSDKQLASMLINSAGIMTVTTVLIWFCLIGLLLTFIASVYFLFTDNKKGFVPYFCFSFVLFIIVCLLAAIVNARTEEALSSASVKAALISGLFGNSYNMDLKLFHISVPGFICFIFAAGAMILIRMDTGKTADIEAPTFVKDIKDKISDFVKSETEPSSVEYDFSDSPDLTEMLFEAGETDLDDSISGIEVIPKAEGTDRYSGSSVLLGTLAEARRGDIESDSLSWESKFSVPKEDDLD